MPPTPVVDLDGQPGTCCVGLPIGPAIAHVGANDSIEFVPNLYAEAVSRKPLRQYSAEFTILGKRNGPLGKLPELQLVKEKRVGPRWLTGIRGKGEIAKDVR